MALSRSEATSLLTDWKRRGFSKEQAMQGLRERDANKAKGLNAKDFGAGVASSVPMTGLGLVNATKYVNPVYWMDRAMNGKKDVSTKKFSDYSNKLQFKQDIRGGEALAGGIVGDIAMDVGTTLATGGLAGPVNAAKWVGRAKKLPAVAKTLGFAAKHPLMAKTATNFAKNIPSVLITDRAQAQARQQDPNTGLGLGLTLAGSAIGAGSELRRIKKATTRMMSQGQTLINADRASQKILQESKDEAMERMKSLGDSVGGGDAATQKSVRDILYDEEYNKALAKRGVIRQGDVYKGVESATTKEGEAIIRAMNMANARAIEDKAAIAAPRSLWQNVSDWWKNKGRALREMGPNGERISNRIERQELEKYELLMQYAKKADNIYSKMSDDSAKKIWNALDTGDISKLQASEMKAYEESRRMFNETFEYGNKFAGVGGEVEKRQNYVKHILTREMHDKIASGNFSDQMVKEVMEKTGENAVMARQLLSEVRDLYSISAKKASYQMKRTASEFLPSSWFEQDIRKVMPAYLSEWSDRTAKAKWFGAKNELIMDDLARITHDSLSGRAKKANPAEAERMVRQLLIRNPQTQWIQNMRAVNAMKMLFSAPTNIADLLPSMLRHGIMPTLSSAVQSFSSKAVKKNRFLGGILEDATMSKMGFKSSHKFLEGFFKATGFRFTQGKADLATIISGQKFAESLLKSVRKRPNDLLLLSRISEMVGPDMVDEFIEKGMTEAIQRRVGIQTLMRTRPISFLNVPFAYDDTGVRGLTTQFKRYAVNLGNVMYDEIIGSLKRGDNARAMKAIGTVILGGTVTGEAVAEGKEAMWDGLFGMANLISTGEYKTHDRERLDTGDFLAQFADGKAGFAEAYARVLENMGAAGGLGLVTEFYEILQSGKYGDKGIAPAIFGPSFGTIQDILVMGMQTLPAAKKKMEEGKLTQEEFNNKLVSAVLVPLPHIKKAFEDVQKTQELHKKEAIWGRQGRNRTTLKNVIDVIGDGLATPAVIFGGVIDAIRAKNPNATDAGVAANMAGSAPGAVTNKDIILGGSRAKHLAEVIAQGNGGWFNVARVIDGDTIVFRDGSRLRMAGVNTAELGDKFLGLFDLNGSQKAKKFTEKMFPEGSDVYVQNDPIAGKTDAFGRKLGYAYNKEGMDASKELIRKGHSKLYNKYPYMRKDEFNRMPK